MNPRASHSLLSICAFVVCVAGCGGPTKYKPQSVPKATPVEVNLGNQKSLLPSKAGNYWVYQVEQELRRDGQPNPLMSSKLATYKISKSEELPGNVTKISFDIYRDDEIIDQQEWEISDGGIYQNSITKAHVPFEPKQLICKFPIKTDEVNTWKGQGLTPLGLPGESTMDVTTSTIQVVDTGVGPLSSQAVETKGSFVITDKKVEGKAISTLWMSPGIGIVRFQQEARARNTYVKTTLRLKNYNLIK